MTARCFVLLMALSAIGCAPTSSWIHSYQRHFLALDTEIDITVYSAADAASVFGDVQRTFAEYEALWSISKPSSDTWKINHRTSPVVTVSPRTVEIARFSQQACMESHGLFDITVAPLKYLYGLEAHQEQTSRTDSRRTQSRAASRRLPAISCIERLHASRSTAVSRSILAVSPRASSWRT